MYFVSFIYFVNRVVSGEIYTAGKNFTLPPAVTALTNLTSAILLMGLRKKNQLSLIKEQKENNSCQKNDLSINDFFQDQLLTICEGTIARFGFSSFSAL